jgi:hypothetical protein
MIQNALSKGARLSKTCLGRALHVDGINSTDHTAEVVGYWQRYTISADFSSAASYLSRYTGTDAENPGRPEIEHFGNCLRRPGRHARPGQVMAHMHGQVLLDLSGKPDPDLQ